MKESEIVMRSVSYNPLLMMLWNFDVNIMVISNFSKWSKNEDAMIEEAKKMATNGEKISILNMHEYEDRFDEILSDNVVESWAKNAKVDYCVTYFLSSYEQKFGLETVFNGLRRNLNVSKIVLNPNLTFFDKKIKNRIVFNIFGENNVFLPVLNNEGEKINQLRTTLKTGNVQKYYELAKNNYFQIEGHVIKGKQKGRGLGYPTANVEVDANLILKQGVYHTHVWLPNENFSHEAMSCFWINENQKYLVETNIFDFDQDIYGWGTKIDFIDFVRENVIVEDDEELKKLLKDDAEKIRELIKKEK